MKMNQLTVNQAEEIIGAKVPEYLIGNLWEEGKWVCEIVIREQLEKHISDEAEKIAKREATRAAREASNEVFLARPRLVVANEGGE